MSEDPPDSSADAGGDAGCAERMPETCVVALRIDDCCTSPIAVPWSELECDPCLVIASRVEAVPLDVMEYCASFHPPICEIVDCTWGNAPSRVAGRESDGSCGFADECASASDCVQGGIASQRCACSVWAPRRLEEVDACFSHVEMITSTFRPECVPPGCSRASDPSCCSECPALQDGPGCGLGPDGMLVCGPPYAGRF